MSRGGYIGYAIGVNSWLILCSVEGKIFYGHKIVLVTASPRFQSMLSSKLSDASSTPTVQINDIRYHIFQLVMQFLYSGGCSALDVSHGDVLELMAAASFFQLEALLRYTEARCSEMVDVDNVVAMYIHAKVSGSTCVCGATDLDSFLPLRCRSTMRTICWNTVSAFCCRTWSLYSPTTTR